MKDVLDSHLWLQEKDIQVSKIIRRAGDILSPNDTKELDRTWRKNDKYFQLMATMKKRKTTI